MPFKKLFSVNGCRHGHWIIFSFVPMLKILACWLPMPKSKNTQLAEKPRDHLWVVMAKKHPQVSARSLEEVSLFRCCFGTSLWRLAGPLWSQLRGKDVTSASLKCKLTLVQVMSVTHRVRAPREKQAAVSILGCLCALLIFLIYVRFVSEGYEGKNTTWLLHDLCM